MTLFSIFSKLKGDKKLHIRQAEMHDLSELSHIHHESFVRGWSDGELEKLINNAAYTCLIAREKAVQPIGFILYRNIAEEAEIITIATTVSARRKGVAAKLLEASIRDLQFARTSRFFLEVDETNEPAIKLYEKFRFQVVGKRESYYATFTSPNQKRSGALVMERQLG